ncbi:ATP-binding protein [Myroides odoratimimus]|uniref:AAA family ATPase n=1 Tax=Myroides odoratimimus TaxID=76832 RepID=UPI0025749A22|nr:AAA family ATPase [Myroides odoratimimus]MDM1496669.1 ATP-binding protein [Myroides odoratimimus]
MQKKFLITDRFGSVDKNTTEQIILTWDDWNDFSYYTLFGIKYINIIGEIIDIGSVRIAYYGQKEGISQKKLKIGDSFNKLTENYFSLGTDDSYYELLKNLGEDFKNSVLENLNDIAFNQDIFKKAIKENITHSALLRDISTDTVLNQYRRIATGGARLTNYSFNYYFSQKKIKIIPEKISFNVFAEKKPSTNIHTIIGRNGVGKSYLINEMIDSLISSPKEIKNNNAYFILNKNSYEEQFTNLICVTFSAFDNYKFETKENKSKLKYQYIGLKENQDNFEDTFANSLGLIISTSKGERWKNTIKHLESDPIFENEQFIELIDIYSKSNLFEIKRRFSELSSGHKIILLTITKLVEVLQEKSLVFFDEPETHLHPPLLSSFIRTFSELLSSRNAVCIMTTHSPIILQEIPRNCVYKLTRINDKAAFERPKLETFGENVGVLTNEVFGLEVTNSGFYNVLKELVKEYDDYDQAINSLDNKLGIEGRSILRSLFFNKKKQNEKLS